MGGAEDIDTQKRGQGHGVAGLFQRLTACRLKYGFAFLNMARRLVEHHSALAVLLNHQEVVPVGNDHGDGCVGLPLHRGLLSALV